MDMNEAIEQAREEQEQEAMEDLQQASDSFPEEVEAEKTPGKNDDIFQKFVDRMVKEFKFSKSIGEMNAIFNKEQANYRALKSEAPAMAKIIEDKYEEMENKLRK